VTPEKEYAIKDFDLSLQPCIKNIVSTGIVGYDSSTKFLTMHATDDDLRKLSKSEHPVLRAVPLREMLNRKTFDHFAVIMDHLDDTAILGTDAGEWGIRYLRVSDDCVQNGRWKDSTSKDQTVKALITKHNYLHSAYRSLSYVQPLSEYYPYIKQMALREPYSDDDLFPVQFEDREYALYALAKYKKTEDIPIIQGLLKTNSWKIGELSFKLMEDYSNTAYLDVYEKYYPRQYYLKICRDQTIDNAVYFIRSLATY
jgi:hypothetical protein